jgi:hypothetical protein
MLSDDLPSEIPDAESKPLDSSERIDEVLYDFTVAFDQAFQQAPPLTHPLPDGYVTVTRPPFYVAYHTNICGVTFVASPNVFDSREKMENNEDYEMMAENFEALNTMKLDHEKRKALLDAQKKESGDSSDVLTRSIKSAESDIEKLKGEIKKAEKDVETAKNKIRGQGPVGFVTHTTEEGWCQSASNVDEDEYEMVEVNGVDEKKKKAKHWQDGDGLYIAPCKSVSTRPVADLTFLECLFYPAPEPRPYKFISFEKMKDEVEAAAPGFKLVHSKTATKDRLRLNLLRLMYVFRYCSSSLSFLVWDVCVCLSLDLLLPACIL